MIVKNVSFVTSVADYANYPKSELPEVTVVGRSNVGKSTVINMLAGQKNLARTSSTPGRTRLINLFDFNNGEFLLVDLPGYGYQAGSKQDAKNWGKLMEAYLQYHMNLKLAFLLLDVRHKPTDLDLHMLQYLNYLRIPFCVIATKCDKIPKSKLKQQLRELDGYIGVGIDNIVPVSAIAKIGRDAVLQKIESALLPTDEEVEETAE